MSIQYEVEQLADSYGVADSFPKDFGYGEEADIEDSPSPSDSKPRILLMGLRRSGKSSIQKVRRDVKSVSRRAAAPSSASRKLNGTLARTASELV